MRKTTGELLNHYAKREPKEFLQLDGWYGGKWAGDSIVATDENGYSGTGRITVELMIGADVRVLIDPSTPASEAIALLEQAVDWLKRDPNLFRTIKEEGNTKSEKEKLGVPEFVSTHSCLLGEDHFGGCPICGCCDTCLNIGRSHWYVCHQHKVRWNVGENLFSSWRNETEDDWQRNWMQIGEYKNIDPSLCVLLSKSR